MAALRHLGLLPRNTRPAQRFLDNGDLVVMAGGTANGGLLAKLDHAERGHDLDLLCTRNVVIRKAESWSSEME